MLAAGVYEQQRGDARELFAAFLRARVYCQRPEQPGFTAVGEPGDGMIPVFSSLAELGAFAGETDYFSTTGRDLLAQLPDGYALVLDPAGEHPLRLDPAAFEPEARVEIVQNEPAAGPAGQPEPERNGGTTGR